MNGTSWVALIALLGWLVLCFSALRARRISARKGVTLALIWLAVFGLVTMVFASLSR